LAVDAGNPIQSEVAYSALRKEIICCRLLPGTRLRINEIALRVGVSVSAAREALSRIAVEGLVVATAQKGFSVAPISAAEITDLTNTRIAIETLCLIDSLKNGNIDWESRIIAAFHRLSRTAFNDPNEPDVANEEWITAHAEFHFSLVAACTSPSLLKIRRSLYIQTERYRQYAGFIGFEWRDVNVEHAALMEAALARDDQSITERISSHFTVTTNSILRSL
jgi:GntR family carbon starvation induced transcriptional regulator